jgi:hypothetical protein
MALRSGRLRVDSLVSLACLCAANVRMMLLQSISVLPDLM